MEDSSTLGCRLHSHIQASERDGMTGYNKRAVKDMGIPKDQAKSEWKRTRKLLYESKEMVRQWEPKDLAGDPEIESDRETVLRVHEKNDYAKRHTGERHKAERRESWNREE